MHLILPEEKIVVLSCCFSSAVCSNDIFFQYLSYCFKSSLVGTLDIFYLVVYNPNLLWLAWKPEMGLN